VQRGSSTIVEIDGTIDVYTASAVGEAIQSLIADGSKNIVLDLTAVTRVDSSGLGTLVGNAKSITSAGGTIWLVGVDSRAGKMLRITRLAKYFRIRDAVEEVLDELEIPVLSPSPS
jgi:anti-sigma B factor antagonist